MYHDLHHIFVLCEIGLEYSAPAPTLALAHKHYTGEQINIFEMLPEISQLILAGFWSHMPK